MPPHMLPPHILSHHDVKDAESHQPTIMRPPPIPSGNRKTSQISRKPLQLITRETPDNVILAAPDKQVLGWLMPCNESSSLPTVELRRNQLECKVGRQVSTNDLVLSGTHVSNRHCTLKLNDSADQAMSVVVIDHSKFGTFIDNKRIRKGDWCLLRDSSIISFGVQYTHKDPKKDYRYVFRHAAISATRRGVYEHYDVDLLNVIGRGASASVCRAMCRKNGKWYALKVVQRPSFRKDDFDFFSREVAILRQLKHPHICRMKQSFMSEEDRNIYLVLELVDGGNLLDLVNEHMGLDEPLTQYLVHQVCEALAYLHGQGIAHRDLKPENVLLTKHRPPKVKVADFGLAKALNSRTALQSMCGTFSYQAPEIGLPSRLGYKTTVDSWSLGVMIFLMLTNKLLFTDDDGRPDPYTYGERTIDWSLLGQANVSDIGQAFIRGLLRYLGDERLTSSEALAHSWISHLRNDSQADGSSSCASHNSGKSGSTKSKSRRESEESTALNTTQSDTSSSPGRRRTGPLLARNGPEVDPAPSDTVVAANITEDVSSSQKSNVSGGAGKKRRRRLSDGSSVASSSRAKRKK